VPVQAAAGAVISHSGAGVGVRSGFLHTPQGDAGVQRRGDKRVPQGVRPDRLAEPGAAGDPADDPRRAMPIQPTAIGGQKDRSFGALANSQVNRPRGPWRQRDGDDLGALAGNDQSPVPALDAQALDVGAGGFGDPQPIEGQQRDQGMLGGHAEPGGNQQRAKLVAVQRGACDS
jgi:hypothetical protein